MRSLVFAVLTVVLAVGRAASASPVLHTTDFIPDASRTAFNGFESLPTGFLFDPVYVFDGIQVDLSPLGGVIVGACPGPTFCLAQEGSRSWLSQSNDNGYSRITLANGGAFQDVGFRAGAGFALTVSPVYINYRLLSGGNVVLAGSVLRESNGISYIGFGGGGFDEIRINATPGVPYLPAPYVFQAIQLDSIETAALRTAVPEPASMLLIGIAGLLVGARRRRGGRP